MQSANPPLESSGARRGRGTFYNALMSRLRSGAVEPSHTRGGVLRVGCVSFLNARPLIDGLVDDGGERTIDLKLNVPSGLLADLEQGSADVALCPVIDYYRSRTPLVILPTGGIASRGQTMTVKLYSRVPIEEIKTVYADTDSHTSVALLQVVLARTYNIRPAIIDFNAREQTAERRIVDDPPTVLLIGDKVVTAAPNETDYPYQLDLGEAWAAQTGLPFVFAVWMARRGVDLGPVPRLLEARRADNVGRIDRIVADHAEAHGWPRDLAVRYLGQLLHYEIGPTQLEAIELFAAKAYELGLIDAPRPLCVRGGGVADSVKIVAP